MSKWRLFLGAVQGAICYGLTMLLPMRSYLKWGLGFLSNMGMLAISFPVYDFKNHFRILRDYLISCLIMGGGLLALYNLLGGRKYQTGYLVGISMIVTVIGQLKVPERGWGSMENEGRGVIETRGRRQEVSVLVDSGNGLREPISGKPACVISPGLADLLWDDKMPYRVIPFHTVETKSGYMRGYPVDKLCLELGGPILVLREVYLAVSPQELIKDGRSIELLVNPKLLYGDKRGVWPGTFAKKRAEDQAKRKGRQSR